MVYILSLFHKTCGLVKESEILEMRPYLFLLFHLTGQRFALREGGRTVGAGVVSKLVS
jgi:translation elongation factor EF-Tu-like GTPase